MFHQEELDLQGFRSFASHSYPPTSERVRMTPVYFH